MSIVNSKRYLHGVRVNHFKNTNEVETVSLPLPERVTIPMLQHMGAPCDPLVKTGDKVFAGQKIGDNSAAFSVPVHALSLIHI